MKLGSCLSSCGNEASSLLTWSMLAACTVGPGTVITCARAGAEDNLVLMWCLVAASGIAYILQEESGRLTMVSGSSFGHALRVKFAPDHCSHTVPVVARVVVVLVFFGNTAYEANCFAGAMGALYVLYEEVWWFRILGSFGTGALTLIALFLGDVETLGTALGVCVVAMAVLFGICAATVSVDAREFGTGLVVPRIPAGSSVTVLSLVSTTAVPFNVFLAASMCSKTASLGSMQRGIGFAAFMTATISILIVVVGSAITIPPDRAFTIEDLGNQIEESLGFPAKVVFCVGLYAAAYSSALTCPLGAALTAEQILYEGREARTPSTACVEQTSSDLKHEADRAPGSTGSLAGPGGVAAKPSLSEELLADSAEVDSSHETVHVGKELGNIGPAGSTRRGDGFQAHGRYFRLSMAVSVAVAVAVSSSGVSTVGVISAAQVINGLLLPFVVICLLLTINDPYSMPMLPSVPSTIAMLFAVALSLFLASTTVIEQSINIVTGMRAGSTEPEPEPEPEPHDDAAQIRLIIITAGSIALLGTLMSAGVVIFSRSQQSDAKRRRSSVNLST